MNRSPGPDLDAATLARDLRAGLEGAPGHGLEAHYQPIVELTGGRIVALEALARWRHPVAGPVPPSRFVGALESHGGVDLLTRWMLGRAVADAARWRSEGLWSRPRVSVNFPATMFTARLPLVVAEALDVAEADPSWLTVEVTETALMVDPLVAARVVGELREAGIRVAIDDFGTGYSCLAQLKRLPVDELKIDGAFVGGLGVDPADRALCAAMITVGHSLGLDVVAERVENSGQLDELVSLGCDAGQGYLFSPPVPPGEVAGLLSRPPDRRHWPEPDRPVVLVVEDNPVVRRLAEGALVAAGYEVVGAPDGASALAAAERSRPVLALVDLGLPDVDGLTLARRLRDLPAPVPVVVALTAADDPDRKVAAFRAGLDDYLVKPFSPRSLITAVDQLRRRRRLAGRRP